MPKKASYHKKIVEGEVTIKEFADATARRGRAKKVLNTLQITKKSLPVLAEGMDLLELSDDDCTIFKNKKKSNKVQEDSNHIYNDYHIDIWFLISEHIKPEDTGRFALICKKTEAVVCSARYWSNLYRLYYSPRFVLPDRLKPDRMTRIGGLRARVICFLFFTCPTFSLSLSKPERNNLNRIEKMQCIEMWYRNVKEEVWMYCYRFFNKIKSRKPNNTRNYHSEVVEDDEDKDIIHRLENFLIEHNNVFENRYEGQHLLVVTSDRFIPFPEVPINEDDKGIVLDLIRQPLSQNLRYNSLEMTFINYRQIPVAVSFYETILDFRIINWWDPEFWLFSDV